MTSQRNDNSTAPTEWWACHKCGGKVYVGLHHDCLTAPMIATRNPYDLNPNAAKEYPGE